MFSQSGTNTPVPSSKNNAPLPIHDTICESITWVNDWFSPSFINVNTVSFSTENQAGNGSTDPQFIGNNTGSSLHLKGWFKTNQNHRQDTLKQAPINSCFDLTSSKWKYLKTTTTNEDVTDSDELDKDTESVKREDTAADFGNTI
ncbi:hypothetical protein KGF56_001427 [Candida oxycetoniae]|uniref:Uncharacterized protein n=1 Tax=Candida oxycetoniae TaxID=497107 RepID=A0AAI9T0L0_9ASCO|nr:uncharacterized protein KGF56_001427 [Candida oxycetoniae]KAI3405820.2 hypothetical protein KGF56_001427 [Candida oxycetoniae]